jgi:hypothetical protein
MNANQEIRAIALAIAEIKNNGAFFRVRNYGGSLVELCERRRNYLAAIERYIADNNYWDVSDDGRRFSMEAQDHNSI